MKKFSGISSNAAKLVALVSMTVDHIGVFMFPSCIFLRVVGRIAFPVFAFMSAESLSHTRSKSSYIFRLLGFGMIFQAIYFLVAKDAVFNVFLTFALAALLCVFYDFIKIKIMPKHKNFTAFLVILAISLSWFVTGCLKHFLKFGVNFDGGSFGVFLPFSVYVSKSKKGKLTSAAAVCALMSLEIGGIQWFSLMSLPLLVFYNGRKGKFNLKYFFYLYYPLHITLIYGLSLLIK